MYEAARVTNWEQAFPPVGVPDTVFEAIAFGEYGSAAPDDMLLVQPINRQKAR